MLGQKADSLNTELELPGHNEVRIEMDNMSGKVPSPGNLAGEQAGNRISGSSATPDVGEAEPPPEVAKLETTPMERPYAWDYWKLPYEYPMVQGDPWETVKGGVDKFDAEMCKAWNGELDTILTFTGLFSAAVTAFCIESFQSLSQSPADTTNIFLIALSQQLSNSSSPVAALSMVEGFAPASFSIYINALYFVSLTLALSVSSVCILGKQWIREYEKDVAVSSRDAVRVRQARFDSLEAWKVPQIMAALPVILLAALLFFFTGLLIQLWNASEHTTAIIVSIVVAFTALMVIVTTVVPAVYSIQPRRTAFTPFRSPQAWVVFVIYRRLQQWYHGIFPTYAEAPITIASWSAFDLHFLEIEAKEWFDHEISSVHRALQWTYETLHSSVSIEKAVYWCFQKQFHPEELIKPESHLSRYVLSGSEKDEVFDNLDRLCYDCSVRVDGQQYLNDAAGRYQTELLIRSAYYAIDHGKDRWDVMSHCLEEFCGIFDGYFQEEIVQHQLKIQDQVTLLLESAFSTSPPSQPSNWEDIIFYVLLAHDSSSPVSREIAEALISRRLPECFREYKSASLLSDIGETTYEWLHESWEGGTALFTHLDKVMMEMCTESGRIAGLNEKRVAKWNELRARFILKTNMSSDTPQHRQLPEGHFDTIHGPLPYLSSDREFLSSSSTDHVLEIIT